MNQTQIIQDQKGGSMTIRESLEQREKEYLSPYASLSMETK